MNGRSAAACVAIIALAAMMVPVGTAHAQGNDGGIKGGFKFGVSQAVDPSGEVNEAFDRAESQICAYNSHSPSCYTVTTTGNWVHVILAVSGVAALMKAVPWLVRLLPL